MSVTRAVANLADDTVEPKLAFLNVHYRAAGATLMGSVARGAYEYPGKTYAGRFQHREPYNRCGACHDVHTTAVKVADCAACHKEVTDKPSLHRIRVSTIDFDGNGNATEGLAEEIEHLRTRLYAAIQAYAKTVAGKPIAYDLDAYPYFFVDTNANGVADKDEAKFPNRYRGGLHRSSPRAGRRQPSRRFRTRNDLGAGQRRRARQRPIICFEAASMRCATSAVDVTCRSVAPQSQMTGTNVASDPPRHRGIQCGMNSPAIDFHPRGAL